MSVNNNVAKKEEGRRGLDSIQSCLRNMFIIVEELGLAALLTDRINSGLNQSISYNLKNDTSKRMVNDEQIILSKLQSKWLRQSRFKECLHPNKEECSDDVIGAHSVQNNRILDKISEDGHVLMFDTNESFFQKDMTEVGCRSATTFTGFCDYHDNTTYADIEDKEFEPGNSKQEFLFSYRAICKEMHAKVTVRNMYENEDVNELLPPERLQEISDQTGESEEVIKQRTEEMRKRMEQATQDGLDSLKEVYEWFNKHLLDENWSNLYTGCVVLEGEYPIAVSSPFNPTYDWEGNEINGPMLGAEHLETLILNVFPMTRKTYILFSTLPRNQDVKQFIQQLQDLSEESQNRFTKTLTLLILAHCENFVYGPTEWEERFSDEERKIMAERYLTVPGITEEDFIHKDTPNLFTWK